MHKVLNITTLRVFILEGLEYIQYMGLDNDVVYPNGMIGQLELDVEDGWHDVAAAYIYSKVLFTDGKLRQVQSSTGHLTWHIEYDPPALYRQFTGKEKELYTGVSEESKEQYNLLLGNMLNSSMQLEGQVSNVTADNDSFTAHLKDGSTVEWGA